MGELRDPDEGISGEPVIRDVLDFGLGFDEDFMGLLEIFGITPSITLLDLDGESVGSEVLVGEVWLDDCVDTSKISNKLVALLVIRSLPSFKVVSLEPLFGPEFSRSLSRRRSLFNNPPLLLSFSSGSEDDFFSSRDSGSFAGSFFSMRLLLPFSVFSCFSCFSGPVPFDELEVAVGVVTELLAYGFSVESVDDNDDDDSVVGIVAASLVLGVIELESVGPTEDSADAVLVCLLREKK